MGIITLICENKHKQSLDWTASHKNLMDILEKNLCSVCGTKVIAVGGKL